MASIKERIDDSKNKVVNGKGLIAERITSKLGVSSSSSDTFQTLADNIESSPFTIPLVTVESNIVFTMQNNSDTTKIGMVNYPTVSFSELNKNKTLFNTYQGLTSTGINYGKVYVNSLKFSKPSSGIVTLGYRYPANSREYSFNASNEVYPNLSYLNKEGTYVDLKITNVDNESANSLTNTFSIRPGIMTTYPNNDTEGGVRIFKFVIRDRKEVSSWLAA